MKNRLHSLLRVAPFFFLVVLGLSGSTPAQAAPTYAAQSISAFNGFAAYSLDYQAPSITNYGDLFRTNVASAAQTEMILDTGGGLNTVLALLDTSGRLLANNDDDLVAPEPGPTLEVNNTTDIDDGTCDTTDCSLREAVNAANNVFNAQSTITFNSTVFSSAQTINTGSLINVSGDVVIDGPGANLLTINANRGHGIFSVNGAPFKLEGATLANGFDSNNSGGIAFISNDTLTLENCVFKNNRSFSGAAVRANSRGSTTIITNCVFQDNVASAEGGAQGGNGAALENWGNATITGSTFTNNDSFDGGAIYNVGSITVSDSTFSGSDANIGGVINHAGSTASFTNCTMTGNTVTSFGGAVYSANNASTTLTNCTLSGNTATRGGAIYNNGAVTITDSTLSGNSVNSSSSEGGAINSSAPLTVNRCNISGNFAYSGGAGIVSDAALTLTNSTFSDNKAPQGRGGGLYTLSNTANITNCTFTGNNSGHFNGGGAIWNYATLNISNTIAAGNTGGTTTPDVYSVQVSNIVSGGYNLIGRTNTGTNGWKASGADRDYFSTTSTPLDAKLGPLKNNGGPTFTRALFEGSPAIDKGNTDLTIDQRGVARPLGAADDIGAYEAPTIFAPTVTINQAATGQSDPATAAPVKFDVVFSKAVTGFDASDVVITGTAGGSNVTVVANADAKRYTVSVGTIVGPGTVIANIPAGAATETASPNTPSESSYSIDNTVTIYPVGPYVVTTTENDDDGNYAANDISLREAIKFANSASDISTITFNIPGAGPHIIQLASTLDNLSQPTNLTGPTDESVTIKGKADILDQFGLFTVNASKAVNFSNLTLADGYDWTIGIGGGAIYNAGTLTVTNCTFTNNLANQGGAIYGTSGTITVNNSTFTGNHANTGGGAIYSTRATTVTGSTFNGNTADSNGGAFYHNSGTTAALTITNSTISGNTNQSNVNNTYQAMFYDGGGGIHAYGNVSLNSCTITGNTSVGTTVGDRGGIWLETGTLTVRNSIIAANTGGDIHKGNTNGTPTVTNSGYNLIGNNNTVASEFPAGTPSGTSYVGTLAAPLDPKLEALQNNGGPTATHAIKPDSFAVDYGDTTATVDQRGTTRPQGDADDIGAYETTAPAGFRATINLATGQKDPAFGTPVNFNVAFNRVVTGFDVSDVVVTGTAGGSNVSVTPNADGKNYVVTVGSISSFGTVIINVEAGAASDAESSSSPVPTIADNSVTVYPAGPYAVTTTENEDDGNYAADDISLREAIKFANADADATTITFNISGTGPHTIQLDSRLDNLSTPVTITGPTDESVTVRGEGVADAYHVFYVESGKTVGISNLTIANGGTKTGGAADDLAGAGIFNRGILTLTRCALTGNASPAGEGGGIENLGTLTVESSTFSGNTSGSYGGAIHNKTPGNATIRNSTISGNTAYGSGGAIYAQSGTLTISNSTISGNTVQGNDASYDGGGAIDMVAGTTTITSSTITKNTAPNVSGGARGGIWLEGGTLTLKNTIVAGNGSGGSGAGGGDIFRSSGTLTNGGNNLIGNNNTVDAANRFPSGQPNGTNYVGTSVAPLDAKLGILADNGGPTFTHALLDGSPALNRGTATGTPNTDQRGVSRPRGTAYDIGAFEANATPTTANIALSVNEDATYTFAATSFDTGFTDSDGDTPQKVKITSLPVNGVLQLGTDAVTMDQEIARASLSTLTYKPNANYNGEDTFGYNATDGVTYAAAGANVNFTVAAINDAPVLDFTGDMSFTAINEDDIENAGDLVKNVILSAGGDRITDADVGPEGIAITAVSSGGTWQYSLNDRTEWIAVGAVSATNARLLPSDDTTHMRFVPDSNFNGKVDPAISFRAWDQTSGTAGETADVSTNGGATAFSSDFETTSLLVNAVNDAPTLADIPVSTDEDTTLTFAASDFDGGFTDSDGNTLATIKITSLPTSGVLQLDGTNVTVDQEIARADLSTLTYQPNENFNGNDSFGWNGSDGSAYAATAKSVNITVGAANDAPTATNLSASETYTEDTDLDLTDIVVSDIDNDNLAITLTLSNPAAGSLNTATSGEVTSTYDAITGVWTASGAKADLNTLLAALTFTPASNFDSDFSIATSLSDGTAAAVTGSKAITGTAVNDGPDAVDDSETVLEDSGATAIAVLENDTDAETDALSITSVTQGAKGTVVITGGGSGLTYEPNADADGSDSFTYTISDGNNGEDTATVSVTITGGNDGPTVANEIEDVTVDEDAADTTIDLTNVFADIDSENLTFSVFANSDSSIVTATIEGGVLTLDYGENKNGGPVTITIRASDGDKTVDDAFDVTVNPINDAPNVINPIDDITVSENAADTTIELVDVFADVDGDNMTGSVQANSNPTLVTATIVGGVLTLEYQTDQIGTATITVRATDGDEEFAEDTFEVTVSNVNMAPVAKDASVTATEDTPLDIDLSTLVSDDATADDNLIYEIVTAPSTGTGSVSLEGGVATYTPSLNYHSTAFFTYKVTDEEGLESEVKTVSITVEEVNDNPTLDGIPEINGDEGELITFFASGLDVDTDTVLEYSLIGAPTGATINSATGEFRWTPTEAQGGQTYNFQIKVEDGEGGEAFQNVKINVAKVNTAPVLPFIGARTLYLGSTANYNWTATDSDLLKNTLTYSLVGAPSGASINSSGQFSWTPNAGQSNNVFYQFKVRVTDNGTPSKSDEEFAYVTVQYPAEIMLTQYQVNLKADNTSRSMPFTYTVRNNTSVAYTNLKVTGDVFWPTSLQSVQLTAGSGTSASQSTLSASSRRVTWTIPSLPAYASRTLSVKLTGVVPSNAPVRSRIATGFVLAPVSGSAIPNHIATEVFLNTYK